MALETTRRSLITGLIALVAAPAIVRASNLMPVKQMILTPYQGNEIVFKASSFCGPFRHVVIYNEEGLLRRMDLQEEWGHQIHMAAEETFTVVFDHPVEPGTAIRME
jgi:hypothetical protein